MKLRLIACVAPIALLAACGGGADNDADGKDVDPASEQALNDDLMSDPDMAGRNEAGAALSGTGNANIPQINKSPAAIQAAQTRALELVGGADALKPAPTAKQIAANAPDSAAMTAAARAAVAPGGENCAEKVTYTTAWAAKLPAALPVYPRGNTREAAGTDEGACSLRIVTFLTPVPLKDVVDFYHTRALAGGYSAEHVVKNGETVLSGTRGQSSYVVYGRKLAAGVTEIDLVTSGQ